MYFMFENMVRALSKFKKRSGLTFFHKLYKKNYIELLYIYCVIIFNNFITIMYM